MWAAPTACVNSTCVAGACGFVCNTGFANCDGLAQNGCETDITTTSNCGTCGHVCSVGTCWNGTCATCSDGIQNEGELGVDCGGPCPACPSCADGIQNQGETGVDCGGPCPACTASTPATAGQSCLDLQRTIPSAPSGIYWIKPTGVTAPFQVYCSMANGGGWTLVLQASSNSGYSYTNPIWTDTSAPATNVPTVAVNQDLVSSAFYVFKGTQSMLCMGDQSHCAAWTHALDTPKDLANGATISTVQANQTSCSTLYCGPNTLPTAIAQSEKLFNATSGTTSHAWFRWGYVNDVNSWGTSFRVGFSGDGDSSDSQDTMIGIGMTCTSNCASGSTSNGVNGFGSGFHDYNGWATAPYSGEL